MATKAILLTEESVGEFAKVTDFTEERLLEVLDGNPELRYVLVTGLNTNRHAFNWSFMDDHYFRSLWIPESELNGKNFVNVSYKEQ